MSQRANNTSLNGDISLFHSLFPAVSRPKIAIAVVLIVQTLHIKRK